MKLRIVVSDSNCGFENSIAATLQIYHFNRRRRGKTIEKLDDQMKKETCRWKIRSSATSKLWYICAKMPIEIECNKWEYVCDGKHMNLFNEFSWRKCYHLAQICGRFCCICNGQFNSYASKISIYSQDAP